MGEKVGQESRKLVKEKSHTVLNVSKDMGSQEIAEQLKEINKKGG